MSLTFYLLAGMSVGGFAGAMALRQAVHSVLALTLGLLGIAGLYLELGAQFVGFAQVLVYAGAVTILAVFAIMTTQTRMETELERMRPRLTPGAACGVAIAAGVFGILAWSASHLVGTATGTPGTTVLQLGQSLMHEFALPFEIVGLLLTAALVGGVVAALPPRFDDGPALEARHREEER